MSISVRSVARLVLACLVALVISHEVTATAPRPKFEPPGAWVRTVDVDYKAAPPRDQVSSGLYYVLSDTQIRLTRNGRESFRRVAMLVVNERGLGTAAQIELRFDPTYQSLVLHGVSVRRANERIEKLNPSAIKLLQRERELEYQIYDGAISASISLDDVRVGDIVEYAYTLSGHNPIFADRHAGRFDLQWSVPVKQVRASLEMPLARSVTQRERNGAPKASVTETVATRRYEWTARDVSARLIETDVPGWFDPYPAVEWTEYTSWRDVSEWGRALYVLPTSLAALDPIVHKLKSEHATPEARAIAALRFVQDEIRYLSVAIGSGAYAPSAPDAVLKRRFGDCKDKSLLLVALLNRLGIRAVPALVNTSTKRGVREMLPSPLAFNHVLVRVELPTAALWMDPTLSLQGGSAENVGEPDYGVALLLGEGVDALSPMKARSAGARHSLRSIDATLDLRQGYERPARYFVVTTHEGRAADTARANFKSMSRDELQKQYRAFYDSYYPGAVSVGSLTFEDDLQANRVVTSETYEIPQFWVVSEARKRREGFVRVPDVEVLLLAPKAIARDTPLAYVFPYELHQTTQVLPPEPWTIANETQKVVDAAFEFERVTERIESRNVILIHDKFASKVDEIPARAVAAYAANLGKARALTDLMFSRRGTGHDGGSSFFERFNWLVAILGTCFLAGWLWLAFKVYRYDPQPQVGETHNSISAIGGWLILLAIGLCLGPLRLVYGIWETMPSYANDEWLNLTSRTGEAYNPLWAPMLLFELAGNLGLLVFTGLLVLLLFKRRTSFPTVYILYSVAAIAFLTADRALMQLVPTIEEKLKIDLTRDLVRAAVFAVIWSFYLKRSVRSRSTFTRRFAKASETDNINVDASAQS